MNSERNNVFGVITAPNGIEAVLRAVEHLVGKGGASVYRSRYNRAETLRPHSDDVEFDSEPLPEGAGHLFNGGVGGSPEEIASFVSALSDALRDAGIEHRFEIYDGKQVLVKTVSA
jgi:hypothetical protein